MSIERNAHHPHTPFALRRRRCRGVRSLRRYHHDGTDSGSPTAWPRCDDVWGARVQGVPPFYPGDGERVYAGTIVSATPMHITPVDLDPNDQLNLSPDGRTISYAFNNYGRTDGADFVTDCADYLTVGPLTADNVPLPSDRIYLGANEIHPDNNPLTIHRHDQ